MIKKSFATLSIKFMSTILVIFYLRAITSTLGAVDSGKYFLLLSIFLFLNPLLSFGLNLFTIKTIAGEQSKRIRIGILQNNLLTSLIFSTTATVILVSLFVAFDFFDAIKGHDFLFMVSLPFYISGVIICSGLIGLGKATLSILISGVIYNGSMLILYYLIGAQSIDDFIKIHIASSIIFFLISLIYWLANFGISKLKLNFNVFYYSKSFAVIAFLGVGYSSIAQMILGFSELFIYTAVIAVCLKITNVFSLLLGAINQVFSKHFAYYYKISDFKNLKLKVHQSSFILIMLSSPVLVFMAIFAKELLAFFNPSFSEYHWVLYLFIFTQFINILTGPTSYLLMMTNYEKVHMKNTGFAHFLSIVTGLFVFSINPLYGSLLIISFSQVLVNYLSWRSCKNILNINTIKLVP